MDKRLLEFTTRSIKRRWKEVLRTFLAAFLAVFFVTGILLFEENMFEWQIASNKERFGNWFVMEANVRQQTETLKNHPKLSDSAAAYCAVSLYNEQFNKNRTNLGYMTPEFIKMGCIKVAEGRMPKQINEVAMDRNTLSKHNILDPKVGQIITLRYYEDNEEYEGTPVEEEMVLVGILEDYSNVWLRSSYLPGAVVTKEKYDAIGNNSITVFIYQLAKSERHGDHRAAYEEILSDISTKPVYNSYVYDYEAWSSGTVYNYMYLLVMVISIAVLTYQLMVYKNSRKYAMELMRKLGATKWQIAAVTFYENVLMLLPAGLLGMGAAALVGKVVCFVIECELGVGFYYISLEILLKGCVSILLSVFACEVVSLIIAVKQILKPKNSQRTKASADISMNKVIRKGFGKKGNSKLSSKHIHRTISFRFTRSNRLLQNIGVRLFALAVCAVLVMCALRIHTTYVVYKDNKDNIDLTGVVHTENDYVTLVPYYARMEEFTYDNGIYYEFLRMGWNSRNSYEPIDYLYNPTQEEIAKLIKEGETASGATGFPYIASRLPDGSAYAQMHLELGKGLFYKTAKNNITVGLSQENINVIERIVGVESVDYAIYETQRAWSWDGMSLEKMGYSRLIHEKEAVSKTIEPYGFTNIFATEYVNPTKELYERLCRYIDPAMQDYDAFAKGEQVLVLLEENPNGQFDDSLTAGETINYHYYDYIMYRDYIAGKVSDVAVYSYDEAFYKAYKAERNDFFDSRKSFDEYEKRTQEMAQNVIRNNIEPVVQTKAAAVIRLDDSIRKEFEDILPARSYYTAIASDEIAKKACARQNDIMADYLKTDELPDSCKAEVVYNQLQVKYNALATFSATDNIIQRYCDENNIEYTSYADRNEKYRTDYVNAVLQYGITIIAVIIINMLICAVMARNRLEARRERTQLLLRLGATKEDVRRVFMIEALREALWCVFTLPLVLVIQYVMYKRDI